MRKFAKLLLTTVCILCLAVLSVGCLEEVDDDDSSSSATHVHVAEDDWHSDGEYHWQLCAECGEEMNKGEHVFTELNVAAQPAKTAYTVGETFDKTGMKIEGECVCGNIEITDYTVAYQTENAQAFAVSDTHVVVSYGELFVNVSVTVGKIKLEKPAADATNFVYNGDEQTYDIAESERYTVSGNKQTNAGSYSVTVALKDAANISWAGGSTDNLTYTFAIAKAENVIDWAKGEDNEYISLDIVHGATPTPQATATSGTTVTFTFANKDKTKTGGWASVYEHPTQYVCIAAVAESENYNAATLERMFTVFKAANSVDWAKDENGYITLDTVYGIAPNPQVTVSGGEITYTYYKAVLTDGQFTKTEKLNAWSTTDCGAGLYCCVVTVAESDDYNSASMERYFTVNKAQNEITYKTNENGDILGLDFVYGNAPIENTAMSKAGALTYTYTLVNKDSTGNPVEPAADAVYAPWSDANISGIYMCKIVAEETDNYTSVIAYRWVRVHKREFDENGVKYAYYENNEKTIQVYYVTGYAGSSTEVNVLEKFNDGAHGEKGVTIVKNGAFAENQQITKVILPSSITSLDGSVFQNCGKLQYVSMIGITDMAFLNLGKNGIYAGASEDVITNNNFLGCTSLKYLVVNKAFNLFKDSPDAQQFVGDAKCIDLYVLGFEAESNVRVIGGKGNNGLLSGSIYYKVDDTAEVKCGQWKFDENGEIVHGASAHNYIDGKCECGEYNTQGVVYEYDADKKVYYVGLNNSLSLSVVNILAKYNDGVHGELEVTYVRNAAFRWNTSITKVILPESIKQLEGGVFQGCENLEYVSMLGITDMAFLNLGKSGIYANESEDAVTNNNFHLSTKLKYLVVNKNFNLFRDSSDAQQFPGDAKCIDLYVFGSETESNVRVTGGNNGLLSSNVYYYSETAVAGCWHYDESGMPTLWN